MKDLEILHESGVHQCDVMERCVSDEPPGGDQGPQHLHVRTLVVEFPHPGDIQDAGHLDA